MSNNDKNFKKQSEQKFNNSKGKGKNGGKRNSFKCETVPSNETNSYETDKRRVGSDNINDWSWYAPDQQLLKQAGSISFFTPQGTTLHIQGIGKDARTGPRNYTVPGIINVPYFNSIGKCSDAASPANVAAQLVYSFVRHMNSGSKNYESSDLMLYLLAMDDIYSHIAQLGKILGLARHYVSTNKYVPRGIIEAMGVNYDDLIANYADYVFHVNTLTAKCKYFNVPKIFPLYKRHLWLASNIFADGPDTKACVINMHNVILRTYSPKTSSTGGELRPTIIYPVATPNVKFKLSVIIASIDAAIGVLLSDEDIGIMSGDIAKAYPNDLFIPGFTDPETIITPFFSNEFLDSFQNMIMPIPVTMASDLSKYEAAAAVSQQDNKLLDHASATFAAELSKAGLTLNNCILNSYMALPDPIQNMLATRFTILARNVGNSYDFTYGTEIPMAMMIYSMDGGSLVNIGCVNNVLLTYGTAGTDVIPVQAALSTVDRHPTIYVQERVGTDPDFTYQLQVHGSFENVTSLSYATLEKLHTCATLGEFDIPN